MPTTNRPFFANFFAAFRAHSALQKSSPAINASPNTTTATATAAYGTLSRTYHTSSSPEPQQIPPKQPSPGSHSAHSTSPHTSSAVTAAGPQSHFRSSRPLHAPNGTPQSRGRVRSTSREASSAPVYGPPTQTQAQSTSPAFRSRTPSPGGVPSPSLSLPRGRRGSDSSASGSVGAASPLASGKADKWYIGGRTAQGEERFYKLGLVKTGGSADRLSLDRLSL